MENVGQQRSFCFFGTIVNNESAGKNYEINFPILIMQQLPGSSKCKLTGACRKLDRRRPFCGFCIAQWITSTPPGKPPSPRPSAPFNYGQHRYTHSHAGTHPWDFSPTGCSTLIRVKP